MGDAKAIWRALSEAFQRRIRLGCKKCKPSTTATDVEYRCQHDEKGIWVVRDDFPEEHNHWTFVREIPAKRTEKLCKHKNCQGGRRCGGAHGNIELRIWKKLEESQHHLHTFLPSLLYYEEVIIPPDNKPVEKQVKKKRTRRRSSHHHYGNYVEKEQDSPHKKFRNTLRKCGGGRFLFACRNCYNLEPRIVKEMDIGIGKVPTMVCKWCASKDGLLFHERMQQNDSVRFYEYQAVRSRLSTSRGNSLCRNVMTCKQVGCTFAHSYLELQVWKLESDGETRLDLVRYCNSTIEMPVETLNGMFHCDQCCLSFTNNHEYLKYMGANHLQSHFSEISRSAKGWIYRPLPNNDSLYLCGIYGCNADFCQGAHGQPEFDEWRTRRKITIARANFKLTINKTGLESFNFEQRPELISKARMVKIEVVPDPITEIQFKRVMQEWSLKIVASGEMKLKSLCFESHADFELRKTKQGGFSRSIDIEEHGIASHEFDIHFLNPKVYGEHIGNLFLEFDHNGKKSVFYKSFRVTIAGRHLEIERSIINPDDWTRNRILIKYPHQSQYPSYEEHIEHLKTVYPIPINIDENTSLHGITVENYVKKMHSLLFKEEKARMVVLSRLNMLCELTFGPKMYHKDQLRATFNIPLSISTDEGTLFKQNCHTALLGEIDDNYAYEAKIVEESDKTDVEDMTVYISPECSKGLQIQEGSVRKLQVQFQLDREPFVLRHDALDKLGEKVSLICPSPGSYASLQYDNSFVNMRELDDMQNKVFQYIRVQKKQEPRNAKINAGKPYPPLIIAGPFGTGKTYTIKRILLHLLEHGNENDTILLCTHANSSANVYLEDAELQKWQRKVLRLYYHGRSLSTASSVLPFCLLNGTGFRYPSIEEIRRYRLVITTFATSLSLNFATGLSGNLFQYIFLDEASQAMEAEVIMPLVFADTKKTKVVIAGDHRQINQKMYSDDDGSVRSLLERMYTAYEDVTKRNRMLLTNNYRCVKGITDLISKLFYKDDILQNASSEEFIQRMEPYYFIHLQGACITAASGECMNESEALQIANEVKMLVRIREDERPLATQDEILVLSAFRSQVGLLRQVFRRQGLRRVSVHTVQNVQGHEYKVVILSTVMRRTDYIRAGGENFGFLSDPRLLNTALTRAKSLIVVVGDAVTLCSTGSCKKSWKTFIKCCEEKHAILPRHVNIQSVRREIELARKTLSVTAQEFIPGLQKQPNVNLPVEKTLQESNDSEEEDELPEQAQINDDESSYAEDDADSWCSEESLDDTILDDMIRKKTGIDLTKVTIGLGKARDEYIQYGSDDDGSDGDSDPNETVERPSRRSRGKQMAIYPKFTVSQLEKMLETGGDEYVRCKIKLENWYSARAFPTVNKKKQNERTYSGNEAEAPIERSKITPTPSKPRSNVIFLEKKENVGRTFDQDEVLVRVIEVRRDLLNPGIEKRIGKVIGVLKKRHKNLRQRRFLCRPDEFNSRFMCPIDKRLPKFAILAPKGHKQSARSDIPIYHISVKDKKFGDCFRKYEKLDERRVYVVRYLKWSEFCPYPLGFVEGSFERGDFRKYLKLEYGVPKEYKKTLQDQARALILPEPGRSPVIDVFTIDPDGSMDLDDAISFKKCPFHPNKDCYVIGVHITDVACIIEEGSNIDKEAEKRFATFYGGDDGPVHMLPSNLGTEKCSLLPGEIRSAISTFFRSCEGPPSKMLQPISPQRNFIRSTRRLTYSEAAKLLRAGMKDQEHDTKEDSSMAFVLNKIWRIMWDWRAARLTGEAYYKKSDSYVDLFGECRAHLLIEEAMVSFNANTAAFLTSRDFEIPMRSQDPPDEEEWAVWDKFHSNLIPNSAYLTSISKYLKKLKRKDEGEEESDQNESEDEDGQWEQAQSRKRKHRRKKQEVNVVLASIDPLNEIHIFKSVWNDMLLCFEEKDFELFNFLVACDDLHPSLIDPADRFRSLQKKAAFKSDEASHFSLRLKNYAWSSSPIRRYVDILIQRCIHAVLDGWPASHSTENAIKRVCSFYDDRHSEYEAKLLRAKVAEYLTGQPIVFEVAIVQVTDAFLKIAIPALGKHIHRYAREVKYEFLNISGEKKFIADAMEDQNPKTSKGEVILTSMELLWKLRFYRNERIIMNNVDGNECGKTVRIPVREWKNFVRLISSTPQSTASEYMRVAHREDVIQAIESLVENATENEDDKNDILTEETCNKPIPIKHKREIRQRVVPGSTFLMQFSGSQNKTRLPEPAVQLLSVAEDLDVCIEHMRYPLDVFAEDAERVKYLPADSMSLLSYSRKWELLVRLDAAYDAVNEPSVTLQGIQITWNKKMKGKESSGRIVNYFSLQHQFCYDRYLDFHTGDLLCLRLKGVPNKADDSIQSNLYGTSHVSIHTVVIHAVITKVDIPKTKEEKEKLKQIIVFFEPRENNLSKHQQQYIKRPGSKWTVEVLPISFPYRCMQQCLSLSSLRSTSHLIQSICLGTIQPGRILWSDEHQHLVKKQLIKFKYHLNKEQREQEQRAITNDFTIIQGPPGTGKSFLGAQIAAKFAYLNKSKPGKKVLYCGPSNKSVDVAAGFLKITDLKVVRQYSTGLEEKIFPNPLKPKGGSLSADDSKMPDDNLKSVALHELIRKPDNPYSDQIKVFDQRVKHGEAFTREAMDAYAALVMQAKEIELNRADIIICTCSYAVALSSYKEITFAQCIIDECAMCSEPETILPLVSNNPSQVVLIGDHMQLKPVITCNKAERLGLGVSLFSRYTEYVGMLTTQYRMHPKITAFPSRNFYEGKLRCDPSVLARSRITDIKISSKSETIFWNVEGIEEVQHFKTAEEGNNSKYNMAQAHAVIKILRRLDSYMISQKRIMVLSPYTAQCAKIRELIQTKHSELKHVHVGTVVTSQGSEADYVILSTVRSLPSASIMLKPNIQWLRKQLGFLTDPNQINVALTRARQRLFVIGNKNLLKVEPLWGRLIDSYERYGAVINDLYT